MRLALLCALSVFVSPQPISQQQASQPQPKIGAEEYVVFATTVKTLSDAGLIDHPVISDQTSTFECGTSCNGMLIGKCSGMRTEDQTAAQALDSLSKTLTLLKKETSADFENKNQKCASL